MQMPLGDLASTAPAASEALRVISYFDVLLIRGAGIDGLLRGAAALSGVTSGAAVRGRVSRRDADGNLLKPHDAEVHSSERSGKDWRVWLERKSAPHPNDEVIIERLAFGLEMLEARRRPESGLEILIDAARSQTERAAVLAQLRLQPNEKIRIIATAADADEFGSSSTLVPTKYGLMRATLDREGAQQVPARAGLGAWVPASDAPASWDAAIVGFRLTYDGAPVVDGSELGAMLILTQSYDPSTPHADVVALSNLDLRSHDILLALVEADSLRSAAATLGMHHSTIQARHEALTELLGYDPRSNLGRMRYIAANLLLRLTDERFRGS